MFPPPPDFSAPPPLPTRQQLPWASVTPQEVQTASNSSNPNKAPGPDGLPFLYLKEAYLKIPSMFNTLYSQLAKHGYHPFCWRESTTAIIRIHNKSDYSAPKAYRPIALLNCLGKTLEKIMATRLAFLAEKNNLLYKGQIGGRKRRNTIDAVMCLAHDINVGKKEKKVISALLLDVKGAFDNVSSTRLHQTLATIALPGAVLNCVKHFHSHRTTALAFDDEREELQPVQTGIPQGSPISPILFLFYLKPLFDKLECKHPSINCPS
jgi:hypothetical protein